MNAKSEQNNLTVQAIYAGLRSYQVNGADYSPEGQILEVSIQESKCWMLDPKKLYSHIALRECLIAGILCNDSSLEKKQGEWTVIGDPIEGASIAAARKARLSQSNLNKLMPKLDAIPFESKFEYMASLHVNVDDKTIYLKGSLEAVLSRSGQMIDASGNIVALDAKIIVSAAESMIEEGLLVIAFAKKLVSKEKVSLKRTDLRRGFIFLGLQGINQIV